MSFIIWLSADIVQLGDNGRNAPYVGLRRAESYLLPEGKCVRHVHICQPTFLSPQFFHLSTILTWGEELLRCSPRDRTASDKLITIYRAPTYTAHPFEVSACGVKTVSGDTLSCTHVTNNREGGWTKLRLSEPCNSMEVWNTWRKLSINILIHFKGSSPAGAESPGSLWCSQVVLIANAMWLIKKWCHKNAKQVSVLSCEMKLHVHYQSKVCQSNIWLKIQ